MTKSKTVAVPTLWFLEIRDLPAKTGIQQLVYNDRYNGYNRVKEENSMSIDVPAEFESFIESLVARRRFLSTSEVVAESLRLLQSREALAEEVQKGFDQIDEGRSVDGPAAFAKLRSRLQEHLAS
ncbi:ribbon-helix-helix domain-containing protein [Novipirellula aureliae]|uniref:ribbon-helix-helix domain-containing protein n=1 Tax=Novipirellula aureliae TaxID=2527966 RepID=UPI0018CE5423|nr:type II toxin-antitoxin system ParD family antitoxin [Novipirellula aureliae]